MLYRLLALPLAALAVGLCALTSCQEQFTTDPGVRLGFSADTLRFDTVFSTIKSPTRQVMVYNHQRKAVRIDRVVLAGGEQSYFQVNVDGQAGHTVNDVEISAGDSAYVFVSVNVQQLGSDSALLVEDRLAFHFNGTTQQMVLQAYGQDVEIWHGRTILNDTTLTAAKPYLIYDSLAIAPGKLLTLEPGCRLYFHNNANLFVYGNLHAVGTAEHPILMRGDRFDAMNYVPPVPYNDVAGQWGGMYLYGAGEHRMEHVSMNSGSVGVFLTYAGRNGIPADGEMPRLRMHSCRLHNFLVYGLVAQNAHAEVFNSLISNTGSYTVYLNGGTHTFVHTTMANYFNRGMALQATSRDHTQPAVMVMNLNKTAPMRTTFLNCAVAGNTNIEFSLAARVPQTYDGTFRHTYLGRDTLHLPQFAPEDSLRWRGKDDVLFRSTALDLETGQRFDFRPDSASVLLGLADPEVTRQYNLQYDLDGNDRYTSPHPAAGACEYREDTPEE